MFLRAAVLGAVVLIGAGPAGFGQEMSKFGVMTGLSCGSFDLDGGIRHLRQARDMCGPGGVVRQWATPDPAEIGAHIRFLALCDALDLLPIFYLGNLPDPLLRPGVEFREPLRDPDGSYATVAASVVDWLSAIADRGYRVPMLEIWNEPNLVYEWGGHPDPAAYGRFLVDVAAAARAFDPEIRILMGGLSPSDGTDDNEDGLVGRAGDRNLDNLWFIDEMLSTVPEAADAIDFWSSHSYPFNHPPEFQETRYSVVGYRFELEMLARHGARYPVVITETGYPIGDRISPEFPEVTEDLRTEYIRRAYRDVWLPDPDLATVCPFLLRDPLWTMNPTWEPLEWVRLDGTPTPQYDLVASLPKPSRSPAPGEPTSWIRGTIRSLDGGPVASALVTLLPRGPSALTDATGAYRLDGGDGCESIHVRASGHADVVLPGTTSEAETVLDVMLQPTGLARSWTPAAPWRTSTGAPRVIVSDDGKILRIEGEGAIFEDSDYLSVRAGQRVRFTVEVRATPLASTAEDSAVTIELVLMNAGAPNPDETVSKTRLDAADLGEWTTVTVETVPRSIHTQRVRALFGVEGPGWAAAFRSAEVSRSGGGLRRRGFR